MTTRAWDRPLSVGNVPTESLRATTPAGTVMAYHTSQLRDYTAMMRALPFVTQMSLSVYLQTSSLTLNDIRVGLSRWALPRRKADGLQGSWSWKTLPKESSRRQTCRERAWDATPNDLKPIVLCASAVYESRYARLRMSRYGWKTEPAERMTLTKEVAATASMFRVIRGVMSAAVCPRIDSWEMVTTALNAVVEGISAEDVRDAATAASTLLQVFSACGTTVPDLIRAGLPEWAHPLADLEPTRGARP